ncbi:MAG: hypothetical protein NT016_03165 [Candidatus Aenigmarchaeota archaeon]|nr:hypothetical protein [Candidatus Aenigmarchaeota archaeon]
MPLKSYMETTSKVDDKFLFIGGLHIYFGKSGTLDAEFPVKLGYVHLISENGELVLKNVERRDKDSCTFYQDGKAGGVGLNIPKGVAKSPNFPLKQYDTVVIKTDYDSKRVSLIKKRKL